MHNYLVVYVTTYGIFEAVVGGWNVLNARANFIDNCTDVCEVEDLIFIRSVTRITK